MDQKIQGEEQKHTTPLSSREGQGSGSYLPILQVGDVLLSPDILTERFCCDYEKCKGACCIEGNAGAPVSLDEIGEIEDSLDAVWADLSASAQSVIDRQGVAYNDPEHKVHETHVVFALPHSSEKVLEWHGRTELQPLGHLPRCREERAGTGYARLSLPTRAPHPPLRPRMVRSTL